MRDKKSSASVKRIFELLSMNYSIDVISGLYHSEVPLKIVDVHNKDDSSTLEHTFKALAKENILRAYPKIR
jgi:hypothetical protein